MVLSRSLLRLAGTLFLLSGCISVDTTKPVAAYALAVQDAAEAATEDVNRCQNETDATKKAASCDRARKHIDTMSKSAATLASTTTSTPPPPPSK